jgi:dolichol kinase
MPDTPPPDLQAALALAAAKAGPLIASLAGAVVSLSFLKELTIRGRLAAVVSGTLIAAFIGPAVTDTWMAWATPSVVRCVHFLLGVGGLGAMPFFLGWMKRVAGDPLSLVKPSAPNPEAKP